MRWTWLAGLALGACTPGGGGPAYVLSDGDAELRIDGAVVDARVPVAADGGSVVATPADRTELGPDELALTQGDEGRIRLYTIGVDVESDLVEARGDEDAIRAWAEALGVDAQEAPGGIVLADPDVWSVLADAERPDAELALRPVSALDLPGTAPLGDPSPTAVGDPVSPLSSRLTGRPAGLGAADADRARAEDLFRLDAGSAELAPTGAGRADARLVGRYCGGSVELLLAADGSSTTCDRDGCASDRWTVADGRLVVGEEAFDVERRGPGQVLTGRRALTDLVIGGCR